MEPLPKYGQMASTYLARRNDPTSQVPYDWEAVNCDSGPDREAVWNTWRDETVRRLDVLIWPAIDRDTPSQRAVRERRRHDLTVSDLHLLKEHLLEKLNTSIVAPAGIDQREHWELYIAEDSLEDNRDPGDTLCHYVPFLTAALGPTIVGALATGRVRKLEPLVMYLKGEFQRPRAYQAALLLGMDEGFSHELAQSGCTPSFISGHCIEALMSCAYFYDGLLHSGHGIDALEVDSLAQYATDVGDRRVFAGVHYPSDSLGSWLTALWLAPHVFPERSRDFVRSFLVNAIGRSAVYRVIAADESGTYEAALDALADQMR